MKKWAILLILLILALNTQAVELTLTPITAHQGDNITINLTLINEIKIWALTVKLQETPASQINYISTNATNRLTGGLNGTVQNTNDKITLYTVFIKHSFTSIPAKTLKKSISQYS